MPETDDLQETPTLQVTVDPQTVERLRARPGLTESDLVRHALEFAHTGHIESLLSLAQMQVLPGTPDGVEWFFDPRPGELEAFRQALAAIVHKKVTPLMVKLWEQRASGLLLLPTIQMQGGKRIMTFRYQWIEFFATPPEPLFAYLLLLFLDSEKPYGRDLCQCRLARCGKFFLADRSQPNRPRTRFCSEEHYQEAHDDAAGERVRRSRENRKKRTKLKAKRRS